VNRPCTRHPGRGGIASVIAILMMAILFTLAISFAGLSNQNEVQAANLARSEAARLQAEAGLSFIIQKLTDVPVSAGAGGNALLNSVAASLAARLDGTPNLQGQTVTNVGGVVAVPAILTDSAGRSFATAITVDANALRVTITGASGGVTRSVQIICRPYAAHNVVFDFGLAAKGPIELIGNSRVRGANSRDEASLLTTASLDGNELSLNGNCTIDGDASLGPADGNVSLVGNVSIGGSSAPAAWNHVKLGAGYPEFPKVDSNVFEHFATNIVDSSTATSGNKTFTNIRVKAGTNPIFAGNITLKGVVFIETPNVVRFTGNLNFTGVVVTQNAGAGQTAANAIRFLGNTTSAGVESLPDTAEFHDLRQMPGSALLAPGFEVEFLGNFGTVNGTMAAEKIKWTGNASGTIYGSIISYGPDTMSLGGNSMVTINRSRYGPEPPGFVSNVRLVPNMDSYQE
jgi:hypothetical protein